jgi:cell division protein FtsW (lipid II flippase)
MMTSMARWWGEYDRRVLVLVVVLLVIGSAVVHGATAYRHGANDPGSVGMLPEHLKKVALGLCVCFVAAQVHYRRAAQLANIGLLVSIGLLLMVLTTKHAVANADIARWGVFFGLVFQPVEIAKLCLVLVLPAWIDRDPARLRRGPRELLVFLAPVLVVGLLLLAQPNFASAFVLATICLIVLWIAGAPLRYLAVVLALGAAAAWFGFTHVSKLETRLQSWWTVLSQERFDPGPGYQSYQALMGLGNGGALGAPAGEGLTRYVYLPDSHTDFVFAVAGEQWGFVGVLAILLVYALLVARALKIASRARDGQAYLTAVAIAAMIAVYTIVNVSMVAGLIPVMGLPLPFVSYGGTALVTNMAAIGVLLNISRHTRTRQRVTARWEGVKR